MTNWDYTIHDIYRALDRLNIDDGQLIFVHSNIGYFGRCRWVDTQEELCQTFFDAVMARIGYSGTLVVPTFTYSFPRKEVFDITAPSRMGIFSEYVRRRPDSVRSADPSYSVACVGEKRYHLIDNPARNSFSINSFFDRFFDARGSILNFNFDSASTFIHYFERKLNVPYRFDKTFPGWSLADGKEIYGYNDIYVRYLHPELEADFTTFDQLARKHGMYRTEKLGRGEMGIITAADTYTLIKETLPTRPWFLTKAEISGIIPENYTALQ